MMGYEFQCKARVSTQQNMTYFANLFLKIQMGEEKLPKNVFNHKTVRYID